MRDKIFIGSAVALTVLFIAGCAALLPAGKVATLKLVGGAIVSGVCLTDADSGLRTKFRNAARHASLDTSETCERGLSGLKTNDGEYLRDTREGQLIEELVIITAPVICDLPPEGDVRSKIRQGFAAAGFMNSKAICEIGARAWMAQNL